MSFLRSADPEAEALAVRRLNRFRSLLILVYLLLWVLLVAWMLGNPPPFPGGLTGGALFRLRLPLWLVFAATCTIGPALAVAFVVAALRLMAQ
ncbi:MAG: hypothetical protein ACYTJ0_08290 [Planctomycetota bacterium]|jgi:hypothetical protein